MSVPAPHPPDTAPSAPIGVYREDETLLVSFHDRPTPLLSVRAVATRAVVLGRGSRLALEVVPEACVAAGVPVLRRSGGGCAVLLDPGNVVLSVLLPVPGLAGHRAWFGRISAWIAEGLESLGVAGVVQRGASDLTLQGRKIGGACIHRSRGLLHYTTTLLVEPDLALMERCLLHPPREPDYRAGRRHRDFVAGLAPLRPSWGASRWARELTSTLALSALAAPLGP